MLEKRNYYEQNPGIVKEILFEGEKRAKTVAKITMEDVRNKMNLG